MTPHQAAPTRRPATARRPEPLSRRNQISQDISIALGPGLQAVNLAGDLRDAHIITQAWTLPPLLWAAVPLAVYTWHKTARRPLPPPASGTRRALTRATTAFTITLAAAATAEIVILIARHRLTWWASWPITPACFALIPLLSARNAARNYHPNPAASVQEGPPMITPEQAALRAELILEVPADDPEHGWELQEFPQGWLVRQHGWEGYRGQFSIVIERENGLVRYFTSGMAPQRITGEYDDIREDGHLDHRWTQPAAR